ncbi:MAG: hypothetical protein AMJ73_04680 [candidate division Zixibacteria bacterium SM1_73]|nr:MAG: hypothetical protein AMJ73_04680 [candidate division Zixibacteria bacterium SM1_73]
MYKKVLILLFFLIFSSSYHCGRGPSPRVVVMDFMEAVNKDDTTTIEKYLDLDRFAQEKLKDLPPEQRAEAFPKIKEELRNKLLGSGATRLKWQNKMIVVNKEEVEGDQALVEVTFVDQKTGLTLYTKTKLYKKDKTWKIYYFKD